MKARYRKLLLAGTTLAALLQFAPGIARAEAASEAPTLTPAPANAGAPGEEIIVTATRRNERLDDVPISISAISQAELERNQIRTTIDLGNITPGLSVAKQAGGQVLFLRGVGSADASVGQEAAVATYVDGVYIAAPRMAFSQFNSIDHVEVLRGPQGTLFGRNATGGLINIITRTPSHEPTMDASVSFGTYKTIGGRFYGSTGLGSAVAADLAVSFQEQGDGYGTNLATGHEIGTEEWFSIRSRWQFDLGSRAKITVIGDYSNMRNREDQRVLLPGARGIDGSTTPADFQDGNTGVDPFMRATPWGVSARLDQGIGSLTLVSISAYRGGTAYQQFDNDMTPVTNSDVEINERFETFTQEVQLQSAPDRRLTWIIGGFYMWDRNGNRGPVGLGLWGTTFGGGVGINNIIYTNSYSAFAEATYRFTDRLRLTAGARYTTDDRRLTGHTNLYDASYVDQMIRPNRGVPTPYLTVPLVPKQASFSDPSYRAILDYTTASDILFYASYSRGFKSGNFNAVSGGSPAFRPETIDAFEVGAKGNLARFLHVEAATYYYNYKDLQLPISNGTTILTTNAANSEIYGVDLDARARISSRFTLSLGAAWVHARYTDYPNARCTERLATGRNRAFTCDVSGNSISRTPEFTFNIRANYTVPTPIGRFSANAVWSYNDGFSWDADDRLQQPAYHIVNAELSWRSNNDRWGVTIFGRNLLDTKYRLYVNALDIGDVSSQAPPLTAGVEVSLHY